MTVEQWLTVAERFGVPAAIALFMLLAFGIVLMASIKGVKWLCDRLFGETGIATTLALRHVQFMDTVERNDDKHTESLTAISGCLQRMSETESAKLEAIHKDVVTTRDGVHQLQGKKC